MPTIDDHKLLDQITKLTAEGAQELEHASLILSQLHSSTARLHWTTTRRGRAAIQHGEVLGIWQAARTAG